MRRRLTLNTPTLALSAAMLLARIASHALAQASEAPMAALVPTIAQRSGEVVSTCRKENLPSIWKDECLRENLAASS